MRPLAAALLLLCSTYLVAAPVSAVGAFATDTDSVPYVDTLPEEVILSEPTLPDVLFMSIGQYGADLASFDPSSGFESLSTLVPGQNYRMAIGFPLDAGDFIVQADFDNLLNTVEGVDCTTYDSLGMCSVDLFLPPDLSSGLKTFLITVSNLRGDSYTFTATTTVSIPPDAPPTTCGDSCASNVLLLPGIEGSRLYDRDGNKLWEPVSGVSDFLLGNAHVRGLFLDANGKSLDDVHIKEGDVIDTAGSDIYGAFIAALNAWKTDGVIMDWRAVAYDWRLSLDDILADGKIEQTLRTLASTSPSGKVTLVAHSNGGLVAKALLRKTGVESSSLVDNLILVGSPQGGAPQALGSLLYGQDMSVRIPHTTLSFPYISQSVTREFALNSPMAYHLLPSAAYFSAHRGSPLVSFNASHAYATERQKYGDAIETWGELTRYLSALNQNLITYAEHAHSELDTWAPPTGISIYELAGAGADTISGIEYYEELLAGGMPDFGHVSRYRPTFTTLGDGTVPVVSALLMPNAERVNEYWFDLATFNARTGEGRKHASLLGADSFLDFARDILTHTTIAAQDISAAPFEHETARIRFMLHSPLSLDLYDAHDHHTGLNDDGSLDENIPDASYGEFGEVKYISAPAGEDYEVKLRGNGMGNFSLDIQEAVGDESTTTTIAGVPTTVATIAMLDVSEVGTISPLRVDEDGNGVVDFSIMPREGETVFYSAPAATNEIHSTTTSPAPELAPELIQEHTSHPSHSSRLSTSEIVIASSSSPTPVTLVANPFPYGPQFVAVDSPLALASEPVAPTTGVVDSQNTEIQLASAYTALPRAGVFSRIVYSIGSFFTSVGQSLEKLSGLGDGS